jgi:hypothetical protein
MTMVTAQMELAYDTGLRCGAELSGAGVLRATACYPCAVPHVLYRLYNVEHDLLYVGLAGSPSTRFSDHQGSQSWWREVATISLEHCESRQDLRA